MFCTVINTIIKLGNNNPWQLNPQGHWFIVHPNKNGHPCDCHPLTVTFFSFSAMISDQPHETELLSPHILPVSIGSQIPYTVKCTRSLSCQKPSLERYLFKTNISIYLANLQHDLHKKTQVDIPGVLHFSKVSEKHLTCRFKSFMQ